ncbi:MAG TPA: hypothetical protein VNY27_07780 [Solirubrobacteraceae bacterium]|jgi:hypothetical protein|nr:hypothetical protein [Solirubrobacteraceae bacterium]
MSVEEPLIHTAINARTIADVDRLEGELIKRFGIRRTRYLGDNESNWSSVASSVDPRGIVFERVTNMWDAVIEATAQRRSDFSQPSPAAAAHAFLHVPPGGPSEMADSERREIAALCTVVLHDSDDPVSRPTLAFRDFGIGITPTEMPGTILSLERNNKLRKPYLHGVFGKGGSVACMFSAATIIVTRKQPDLLGAGEEDRIAIAVVRQGDADDVGLPFFRYVVGPDDLPWSVAASEAPAFEPGTLVVQVGYQAEKMGLQNWQNEESIYAYAETLLFRPTLPYGLQDARSGEANRRPVDRRSKPEVVMGLGQRLETPSEGLLAASRPATLDVPGLGKIKVRWWLFEHEDRIRRRIARGNVVLFTASGHVHHAWNRQRFTGLVEGRRRVAQRIIVEVDTDAIPQKTRVQIFSSFRDRMLKMRHGAALEQDVAEWLSNEPELGEAESQFTRQALRSTGGGVTAAFRQRLNRAIRTRVPGLSGRRRGPAPRPPRPIDELHPEPTIFTGPETVEVVLGQRKSLHMQCNAVDGFVPDTGAIEIAADETAPEFAYGVGDLRRGRIQLSLLAPGEALPGDYQVTVSLSWMRSAGGFATLSWPIEVKVVTSPTLPGPPKPRNGGHGNSPTKHGEIAFLWQRPSADNGWTDKIVGELQDLKGDELAEGNPDAYGDLAGVEETIPTIVLNEGFTELHSYLSVTAHKVLDPGLQARKDRYGLAVGVTVANLWTQEDKLQRAYTAWEQAQNGREEPPKPMTEEQRQRALVEHARGVIALLPDFDELLADDDGTETMKDIPVGATTAIREGV